MPVARLSPGECSSSCCSYRCRPDQTCSPMLLAAGQTELPTCPVCLERLDEHISGVVTTVSPRCAFPCNFEDGLLPVRLTLADVIEGQICAGLVSGLYLASAAVTLLCDKSSAQHSVPSISSNMICIFSSTYNSRRHCRFATTASTTSACSAGATPSALCAATVLSHPMTSPSATAAAPPRQAAASCCKSRVPHIANQPTCC